MSSVSAYQAWLEAHLVSDDRMGQAYESLSGQERAVLKKCIARLYTLWGESPRCERRTRSFRHGFSVEEHYSPALYALFFCEPGLSSPAALLAALMPALLAGVDTVLPCFATEQNTDSEGPPAAFLGALEQSGIERAFIADEGAVCELAALLHSWSARGRIVVLGGAGFGEKLILFAHRNGIPCSSLTGPLLYYSNRLCAMMDQRFGEEADSGAKVTDCAADDSLFLHLDASHEDVWIWPSLCPDWFRARRMRLFAQQ